MRKLKFYFTFLALSVLVPVFAQVQVDKPIELTGLNNNDRLIKNVGIAVDTSDAVSAAAVQNGYLIYSMASGNINNYAINISPAPAAYVAGMSFNFVSNQTNSGAATLNVNGLGAIPIVKNVNQPFTGCELQAGLIVTVVYDGTNFQMTSAASTGAFATTANAGPDQDGVSGTVTLAANTPVYGTGSWSIVSGTGGSITDSTNPASTFTGLPGDSYVLRWTISGCNASNSSDVNIVYYMPGSQTFSYTGAAQSFTVPVGVYSINAKLWGAGGGGAYGGGVNYPYYFGFAGGGAFLNGALTVAPGQALSIIVGQGGDYTRSAPYGGGGAGTAGTGTGIGGSGGGRSAIQIAGNDILTAGAGGGSGNASDYYWMANGGGGGATSGANGTEGQLGSCVGVEGGQGGTTGAGGAGGISCNSSGYEGTAGNQYTGGNAGPSGSSFTGGGGGGGYYGGGGGGSYYGGGGGGGSSYYPNTGFTLISNIAGSTTPQRSAPWAFSPAGGNTDPDYQAGIGNGGYYASQLPNPSVGGNGLVVISW